jgi:hypothetical protein
MYIVFVPQSASYTFSLHAPSPTGSIPPERTCSALLFSNSVKKKTLLFV